MEKQPVRKLYDEVWFDSNRPYEKGGWRNLPEIVHDEFNIKGFFGDYRWLSNFGPAKVQFDGVIYSSVEVAYQAAKRLPHDRKYFLTCSSKDSISYNRDNTPTMYTADEWDVVKVDIMRLLLKQKFDPKLNPENTKKLCETGVKYLEETNWWNDTFWGRSLQGKGQNILGNLIMDIRTRLLSTS